MEIQGFKVISNHYPKRMQVCFIGLEITFNRRGKKVVKKVSKTRHLHLQGEKWMGWGLETVLVWRDYTEFFKPKQVSLGKAA